MQKYWLVQKMLFSQQKKIIEKQLSVRQSESLVKIFKTKKISKFKIKDPNLKHLELTLADKIGLNVLIKNNKYNAGSITLEYKNLEQLNNLIEVIKFNYQFYQIV